MDERYIGPIVVGIILVAAVSIAVMVVPARTLKPEAWLDRCTDVCADTYGVGVDTKYCIWCVALCQSYYYEELME